MKKETIKTDKSPKAIGPYSQGVIAGNMIFTSGQLPINPETSELVTEDIKSETRQALNNLKAVIEEANATLDDVVKVTVFIRNMDEFGDINEVYGEFFDNHKPARSCVEVAKLPKDANIEVEAIIVK